MYTFTPEELMQYMYRETSPQKTAAIEAALENDWELREAYETFAATQKNLKKLNFHHVKTQLKRSSITQKSQ